MKEAEKWLRVIKMAQRMAARYNNGGNVWKLDAPGFCTAMRWAELAVAAARRDGMPHVAETIEAMWALAVDTCGEYN